MLQMVRTLAQFTIALEDMRDIGDGIDAAFAAASGLGGAAEELPEKGRGGPEVMPTKGGGLPRKGGDPSVPLCAPTPRHGAGFGDGGVLLGMLEGLFFFLGRGSGCVTVGTRAWGESRRGLAHHRRGNRASILIPPPPLFGGAPSRKAGGGDRGWMRAPPPTHTHTHVDVHEDLGGLRCRGGAPKSPGSGPRGC